MDDQLAVVHCNLRRILNRGEITESDKRKENEKCNRYITFTSRKF